MKENKMELVDMKLPKRNKEEVANICCDSSSNEEQWPYGLQLRFEKEQVDKLPGLLKFKVGDKILI
jgi:hypothetical protein